MPQDGAKIFLIPVWKPERRGTDSADRHLEQGVYDHGHPPGAALEDEVSMGQCLQSCIQYVLTLIFPIP